MRRFLSHDRRWRVDVIRLSCTGDHRDGEVFRISHDGYFIAEVKTVAELSRYLDLSALEESLLTRCRRSPARTASADREAAGPWPVTRRSPASSPRRPPAFRARW